MSASRYIRKRPVAQSISEDETLKDSDGNTNDPLDRCTSSSLLPGSSALSTLDYDQLSSVSLKSLYDWCVYHTSLPIASLFCFHLTKKGKKDFTKTVSSELNFPVV